jgi:hypothetical protein
MTEIAYVCRITEHELESLENLILDKDQVRTYINILMQESFNNGLEMGKKLAERRSNPCSCKETK